MMIIRAIVPLVVLLLVACAPKTTTFIPAEPASEKGSAVYIYRASKVSSYMLPPAITINNSKGNKTDIGRLNYGEYKLVYLMPGKYDVHIDEINFYVPGKDLLIKIVPDKVHYLRLDASLKFETGVRYKSYDRKYDLVEVDNAVALEEMASCIDVDKKPKKENRNSAPAEGKIDAIEAEGDAHFSTDKTADPFSRNH